MRAWDAEPAPWQTVQAMIQSPQTVSAWRLRTLSISDARSR
jgi:hypothetical protein